MTQPPSRLCTRSCLAALALLLCLAPSLPPSALAAGDAVVLRQITKEIDREGLQAQRPVWASGRIPLLTFELTDRARKTHLTVTGLIGDDIQIRPVPGASSGRLGNLGAGQHRADMGVAWWPGRRDLVFVRNLDGGRLMYYDGSVRPVPELPDGDVLEASLDAAGHGLDITVAVGRQTELHRVEITNGQMGESRRLLRSEQAIHSLTPAADGQSIAALGTTRGATRLLKISTGRGAVESERSFAGFELLSLGPGDGPASFLAYARRSDRSPDEGAGYVLLGLSHELARPRVLAERVYLTPGLAPQPAISSGGRFVYFVRADPKLGNPIVRLDRRTGHSEDLVLSTRGHQEVAVGEFADATGKMVPWIAVVAVGDQAGDDVANHLFFGPLGPWAIE